MKKGIFPILLCAALLFTFVWGILQLFEIRFTRGDIYPPYSTLRVDPLGARAFYESLSSLPGLDVSRNERELGQFAEGRGTVLFYLGARGLTFSEETETKLEKFIRGGGRLVVSFFPQSTESPLVETEKKKNASPTPGTASGVTPTATPLETPTPAPTPTPFEKYFTTLDLGNRWGFKLKSEAKLVDSSATSAEPNKVDAKIPWHSALHFGGSGAEWQTIYKALNLPVVIERSLGEGSIVLAADSYSFSNEALRKDRQPAFLSWLVGPSQKIIFDETHLGLREDPGVGSLMRRYRLGGLIAGLFLLAALAIWKNASPLIPRTEVAPVTEGIVEGRDAFSGLINLLRRNIAPRELVRVCVDEWARFLPHKIEAWQERVADLLRHAESGSEKDPVRKYQEINLEIKKTKWKPPN